MASSYTYKIVAGDQTFAEFLYGAARAMTPFIHMRDTSGAKQLTLPAKATQSDNDADKARILRRLESDKDALRLHLAKSLATFELEFAEFKAKEWAEYAALCAKRLPIRKRLNDLRSRVAAWEPPTPDHGGLKDFMLEQLDDSLQWDARIPEEPEFPATVIDYRNNETEWLRGNVESQAQEYERYVQRGLEESNSSLSWIAALVKSEPPPEGTFAKGELKRLFRCASTRLGGA